jgi:hypothetical protein
MAGATVAAVVDRVLAAYAGLVETAETIEDEWAYVTDLGDAWRRRFAEVVTERGAATVDGQAVTATERAIAEIGRISDPHRAIDWMSTYPQIVLRALGERP